MVLSKKVFVCGRCDKIHDKSQDALDCCPTDIIEQYQCSGCGSSFNTEDEATECCKDDE